MVTNYVMTCPGLTLVINPLGSMTGCGPDCLVDPTSAPVRKRSGGGPEKLISGCSC